MMSVAWKLLTVFGIIAQLEVFTCMPHESDKTTASPTRGGTLLRTYILLTKDTEEQEMHNSGGSTMLVFKLH